MTQLFSAYYIILDIIFHLLADISCEHSEGKGREKNDSSTLILPSMLSNKGAFFLSLLYLQMKKLKQMQ